MKLYTDQNINGYLHKKYRNTFLQVTGGKWRVAGDPWQVTDDGEKKVR